MTRFSLMFLAGLATTTLSVVSAGDCETFKGEDSCLSGSDMDGEGCQWCKSAAVPSSCHNATMAEGLPSSVFDCNAAAANELEGDANYLVLALQKCQGSSTWTLHGLWPEWGQNCGSEKFDEAQISSIESDMEKYWLSCPEYSDSNVEFWDHEWSKHGTCTTDSQSSYFR